MEEDFRDELFKFIKELLKPENLTKKRINGKYINASEYLNHIKHYFQIFQTDNLPKPQTVYESSQENQMTTLVNACLNKYKETRLKHEDLIVHIDQFPVFHQLSRSEALRLYDESRKMGNYGNHIKYKDALNQEIEKIKEEWKSQTEKSIKKIEEEKEKLRQAEEEKKQLELEHKENEKRAIKKIIELEKSKTDDALEYEKKLKEMEIAAENSKREQEVKATEKLQELEELRAKNIIEQEKYVKAKELADEKQNIELNRIAVEKEAAIKKLEAERKLKEEETSKLREIAEEELKIEKEQIARLEAEKEKEKALRISFETKLKSKEWEQKYVNESLRPCKKSFVLKLSKNLWYKSKKIYNFCKN